MVAIIEAAATYVNHRQLVGAEPETIADHWRSIRALVSLIPDMRIEAAEILAHSAIGVVTNAVVTGRTSEGTTIELPAITLILFNGTRVTRMEAFDIDQRDLAVPIPGIQPLGKREPLNPSRCLRLRASWCLLVVVVRMVGTTTSRRVRRGVRDMVGRRVGVGWVGVPVILDQCSPGAVGDGQTVGRVR